MMLPSITQPSDSTFAVSESEPQYSGGIGIPRKRKLPAHSSGNAKGTTNQTLASWQI